MTRPFEGLPGEADWVAMREIVPAATAVVRTTSAHGARDVIASTVLPMAWPAMHRADGSVLLGLQTQGGSGDPSRDAAAALLTALDGRARDAGRCGRSARSGAAPAGRARPRCALRGGRPHRVRLLAGRGRGRVRRGPRVDGARQRRRGPHPAADLGRLGLLVRDRPPPASALGPHRARGPAPRRHRAPARRGPSAVVEGSRYVGAFRADGLLVPVWDLAPGTDAEDLEAPVAAGRICWPRPSPRPRP